MSRITLETHPGTQIAKISVDTDLPTEAEINKMSLPELIDYLTEEDKIALADFCRDRIRTQEHPEGAK